MNPQQKRQKIKQGIARKLYETCVAWTGTDWYPSWDETKEEIRFDWRKTADEWLGYLHSQGLVIVDIEILASWATTCPYPQVLSNCYPIISLIEEESNGHIKRCIP